MAGLALLSLILMFVDSHFDYVGKVRYYLSILVTPLHLMADLPSRTSEAVSGFMKSRQDLESENSRLQDELMMLQFNLQKLDHLEAENQRLNELLKASATVDDVAVRAQLLGESPDPLSKRLLINKGSNEGVYVGQPVVDANGLIGQVELVEPLTSWVLLITDPRNKTPVQVNRNGVRAIAAGTPNSLHQLVLENVAVSAEIQVGDLLVTSGLDGRMPAGYKVGVVTKVDTAGSLFAEVHVNPTARFDRSRNVLLLYSTGDKPIIKRSERPVPPGDSPSEIAPETKMSPDNAVPESSPAPVDGEATSDEEEGPLYDEGHD